MEFSTCGTLCGLQTLEHLYSSCFLLVASECYTRFSAFFGCSREREEEKPAEDARLRLQWREVGR